MVASALAFTAMTTLIKFLGDDYSASLQTFYRQLAGFVILLSLMATTLYNDLTRVSWIARLIPWK